MSSKRTIQAASQRGFSLVEMMIAMTIGLLIVLALTTVVIGAGQANRANSGQSELQTNGQYALDMLKRDIQNAGYYGLTGRGIADNAAFITIPAAQDCLLGFALNLSQRVWGSNNGINPFDAATCPELANVQPNTDMLVLRYLSTSPVQLAPGKEGGVSPLTECATATGAYCFRSAYEQGMLFNAGNAAAFFDRPQQDHVVEVKIYYVNKNTVGADGIPSLRRYALSSTGVMTDELVVSGVENLQVQYAVDSSLTDGSGAPSDLQYFDAQNVNAASPLSFSAGGVQTVAGAKFDAVAQAVDSKGVSLTAWGNVSAVRLWLLVKNSRAEAAPYSNTTQYGLGGAIVMGDAPLFTPNDRFRRQVFTSTMQLRN